MKVKQVLFERKVEWEDITSEAVSCSVCGVYSGYGSRLSNESWVAIEM